jgi:hypothetical protein
VDEVTVRLDFVASQEAHQAGVLIWQDQDNYIRLGRRFQGRNEIDFMLEQAGKAFHVPGGPIFDGEGQSGAPIWLSIQRIRDEYRAFTSGDGRLWTPIGQPFQAAFRRPRAGIYAMHGRRDATPATAGFTALTTGWTFLVSPGYLSSMMLEAGWREDRPCPVDAAGPELQSGFLQFFPASAAGDCNQELTRPIAGRDWEITTKMDYLALPGTSAGLTVRGDKGSLRVVRYVLNSPSIVFIHDGRTLVGEPDRNGSPFVFLRLTARDGVITGSFSPDGEHFRTLPARVALNDIGSNLRGGLRITRTGAAGEKSGFPARFFFYRESVLNPTPWP